MEGSIQISRDLCWLYLQVMEMFILPYALPLQCYTGSSLLVYISTNNNNNNNIAFFPKQVGVGIYQLNPKKIMKHIQLNSQTLRIDQESK